MLGGGEGRIEEKIRHFWLQKVLRGKALFRVHCKQILLPPCRDPLRPFMALDCYNNIIIIFGLFKIPFGVVFYFINKQWPFINKFKQWRKSVSIRGE